VRPSFLVLDEPTSALDVSVQAQVLNLLNELQEQMGLTFLFISHDLRVVRSVADRTAVMYLGRLVELTSTSRLYDDPRHPYTWALLSAIPKDRPHVQTERLLLPGDVPSPVNIPSGCRFVGRCPLAASICKEEEPPLREITLGHWVACHFADVMRAKLTTRVDQDQDTAKPIVAG
jgi:oligopeptide/dipeptide ABC transporter ATP-binding protein